MTEILDFLAWLFSWGKYAMETIINDDGDPLEFGCMPLPDGWYPDGVRGKAGMTAYQALIPAWATAAQKKYQPMWEADHFHFYKMANRIGDEAGLPRGLLGSILEHESKGKPWLFWFGYEKESTAIGLGGIVYTTAKGLKMPHTFHAETQAREMTEILKRLLARKDGNLHEALKSYAGNPATTLYDFYLKHKDSPKMHYA